MGPEQIEADINDDDDVEASQKLKTHTCRGCQHNMVLQLDDESLSLRV